MTKVYRVYNSEMISFNAKITPKMVKFELRHPAFGYKTQEYKNMVALTPQEAIQEKRNQLLSSIGMLEEKLRKQELSLGMLNELALNYK